MQLESHWDTTMFHGIGAKGLEAEKVVFNGSLHEAALPFMIGRLTSS
jgi:hypothetical protein